MSRSTLCLILLFFAAYTGKNYAAGKKESIAVFDFKLQKISPDAGNIVRNRIEYNLFQTRKFIILERNRIDIIRKEKILSGGDIESSEAVSNAGRLLPADYVITGEITLKEKVYLNIVLVDTSNGTIINSFSRKYKTENDLIEDSEQIASLISEEILYNRVFDTDRKDYTLSSGLFINMGASYIPKAGKISDFADNGYMVTLHTGFRNVLIDGNRMGFLGGYAHIYTKESINYISIAPLQWTVSYELQPYRRYFIIPGFGFGTAQVTIKKNEYIRREFEACGLFFLELKYHIKNDLAFIIHGNHYILFENDGNVDFNSFGGGFEMFF